MDALFVENLNIREIAAPELLYFHAKLGKLFILQCVKI
jgi:hypothetical protein